MELPPLFLELQFPEPKNSFSVLKHSQVCNIKLLHFCLDT